MPSRSLDEIVLVVNASSGLGFDPRLPGFHLYGTDIALSAQTRGWGSYVCHAPVIHNSTPARFLDSGYRAAYDFMRRKWKSALPVQTCVVPITAIGWPLWKRQLKVWFRDLRQGERPSQRITDVASMAASLGYDADSH